MPFYINKNKLYNNKICKKIDKTVLINYINTTTTNRLVGKNASIDMSLYSYEDPYFNGVGKFTRNPSCWINGVKNISCASPAQLGGGNWWNRSGTLITPKHIVYANHYPININAPILFVDENNNVVRRTLVNSIEDNNVNSDVRIGVLNSDVPSNIKIAKVLPKNFLNYFLANKSELKVNQYIQFNTPLYAVSFNQARQATLKIMVSITAVNRPDYQSLRTTLRDFNTIYGITTEQANKLNPHPSNFTNFFVQIIGGDSGKPAFLIIDDEFVMLSAYWVPDGGPFLTERYDIINSLIQTLSPGQGYSLTPIDLNAVYYKYAI